MKKRILALFSVLLLAVLMTAAVSAADGVNLQLATAGTGVDLSALEEGQTFDVYVTVGPTKQIGSNPNYIYRVAEDTVTAAPNKNTNKLTAENFAITWDTASLEVSAVSTYPGSPSTTLQSAGDGLYYAFLGSAIGTKLDLDVSAYGTGSNNTGSLSISYDGSTTAAAGFIIRGEKTTLSSAPATVVVAKITFKVVTGAEGGDETVSMVNTYTYNGTAKTNPTSTVSVGVVKGCAHENKTALTPAQLTEKGLENITVTCYQEGVTWYQCNSDCGKVVSIFTEKLPHNFNKEAALVGHEPTCLSDGKKAMYCSNDGCTEYDADTVTTAAQLGHSTDTDHHAYDAPSCTDDGYDLYYCVRCGYVTPTVDGDFTPIVYANGNFTTPVGAAAECPDAVKLAATGHNWVADRTENGVTYYVCSNDCGADEQEVSVADTVRYVSTNGGGDGSSVDSTVTLAAAFDAFKDLPKNVECTIYLVGDVTLAPRQLSSNNTQPKSFEETSHEAHVTITTAPGKSKASLFFPFSKVSHYYLYGPTTFDNIYIASDAAGTTSGSSASIAMFGRGFDLEMTENIEMKSTASTKTIPYSKTGGNWEYAKDTTLAICATKVYLCGGFYTNGYYDGAAYADGYSTNMIVNGGSYWVVVGGSRTTMTTTNCELNISVGGNAQIGQIVPINTSANSNITGTVANIHYYGGATIAVAYRAEMQIRGGLYTVNHFFHNGCSATTIGDFVMGLSAGAGNYKNVNCYYSVSDTASTGADEYGLAFIAKTEKYAASYLEYNEFMTFVEWCIEHGDGHDFVDGVCSFCDVEECRNHKAETVVISEPTCVTDGVSYERCSVCYEVLSDTVVVPADPTAHVFAWDLTKTPITSVCTNDGCGYVRGTYTGETATLYVSDKGYGDGGFSADYPLNDFLTAFELAAASGEDATIYIVGSITVYDNFSNSSHTVFAEPTHANKITVCGYKNSGVFKFAGVSSTGKTIYAMNGDTTFENLEFSSWGNVVVGSAYFYLAAQHNNLVLGENVSTDFMRNTSSGLITGAPIILGGCYHSAYRADGSSVTAANCAGGDNNVTICSGTYYEFIGGSVGAGGCGSGNCSVTVSILGDVSFRDYVSLGGFEQPVGDITFILDGSLSVGNYFSLAGVNKSSDRTCGAADSVTVYLYSGSVISQNFQSTTGATTDRPLGCTNLANADGNFYIDDLMANGLTVYYAPANASAVSMYNTFKAAPAKNTVQFKVIDSSYCEVNRGDHRIESTVEEVASTCAAQGYGKYICADCGETYTVSLDPVAHTFGEGAKAIDANCIDPQIDKKTCSECGFIEYYVNTDVPATGVHTYEDGICVYCNINIQDLCEHEWGTPTTVTSGCGVGTQTVCNVCGKTVIDINSADHKFGAYTVTVAPTATEPGIKTRVCKSCGKTETAIIYADGSSVGTAAIATDASGNLADLEVVTSKLSSAEKAVLNALLQDTAYGSEVKVSYEVEGDAITNITYSIPLPAEYADMQNVKVIVKDDNGDLHMVEFTIDKGYIVFTF